MSSDEERGARSPMVSDSDSDEMAVKVEVKKESKKRKMSKDGSRKKLKKRSKKIEDSDDEGAPKKEMIEKEASESEDDDVDGSDDEEESDSDNEYQADGFVVDDMEESDDDDDNSGRRRRHRKKKEKKLRRLKQKINEIDDEDLMLVRENLGMDTGRAHSDDDSDDDDLAPSSRKKKSDDSGLMSRDLAYRMFGDSDDEEENEGAAPAHNNNFLGDDDYVSDDIDEFIVDDDEEGGREGPRRRRKQAPLPPSMQGPSLYQMGEAEELFGDMEGFLEATRGAGAGEGKTATKSAKAALLDKYEPDVLKEHMMTRDIDAIRERDIPERYQKLFPDRQFPDAEDRAEESEWISNYIIESIEKRNPSANLSRGEIVQAIDSVLRFYHDDKLEPAFVQRYCKEYWKFQNSEGLHTEDLYSILELDVKWDKLVQKKKIFQSGKERASDAARPKEARFVRQCLDDVEQTMDERNYQDLAEYFALDAPEPQPDATDRQFKRPTRRNFYQICTKTGGLRPVAMAFTMDPTVLGGILIRKPQDPTLSEIPTPEQIPDIYALDFISKEFPSADDVMKGARHIAATKLAAEPSVRKYLRDSYRQEAVVSTQPTRKGFEDIDEFHYCSGLQHLDNMPVGAVFASGDLWLRITRAEKEGLVQITIAYPDPSKMVDDIATIYQKRTEGMDDEWETQRFLIVQEAVGVFLIPSFENELRHDFLVASREFVVKQCGLAMRDRLNVRPFESRDGVEPYIMSIWVEDSADAMVHMVALDENGEVVDKAQASFRRDEKHVQILSTTLLGFLQENSRTHVVVINTSGGMKCMDMGELLEAVRHELGRDTAERFGNNDGQDYLDILVMKDDVATMYSRSKRAEQEFPGETEAMRAAIGLGRYLRNPACELCAMWGNVPLNEPSRGRELLYLNVHPMQRSLVKDMLLREYDRVFVEVVNKFGVDINQAANHKHLSYQLQFICGLGPVKATALLDKVRVKGYIERRQEVLSKGMAGKIVYRNCAGFLRIREREALKEAPLNPLDDTRIHPESYYMAVKMCGDANNNSTIDMYDPNQYSYAVEDIMFQSATAIRNRGNNHLRRLGDNEIQDSLSELDLPAYAQRLESQKKGPKQATLEYIKRELRYPYFDKRPAYEPPQHEELFLLLHGETKETFRVGMIVPCSLLYVFNDFVRVRLQNAMRSTLRKSLLPDYMMDNDSDYIRNNGFPKGLTVNARVLEIRPEPSGNKFEVVLGCNSTSIRDIDLAFDSNRLPIYARKDLIRNDLDALVTRLLNVLPTEENKPADVKDPNAPLVQAKRKRRQIGHPLFHNWNCQQAVAYLRKQPVGDVVIRPSTFGTDHVTLTWKMLDGVYRHFDVLEKDKPSEARLGQKLVIKDEVYENIDEMVARFVDPMNELVEDVLKFKYFKSISEEQVHEELIKEKKEHPGRIPYIIHVYARFAGCFSISYVARTTPRSCHMEVKPGGFRFFGRIQSSLLPTLNQALQFFKMKALVAPAPKPDSFRSGSAPFAQQSSSASTSREGGSGYYNNGRERRRESRFEPRRDDRREGGGGYGYRRDGGHYESGGGYH